MVRPFEEIGRVRGFDEIPSADISTMPTVRPFEEINEEKPRGYFEASFDDIPGKIPTSPSRALDAAGIVAATKRLQTNDYTKMPAVGLPPSPEKALIGDISGFGYYSAISQTALHPKESTKRWTPERQKQYDIQVVNDYFEDLEEKQRRGYTLWGQVGAITSEMPSFVIGFVATGGLRKMGQTAGKKAATKMLRKYATTTAGKAAIGTSGFAVGTGLQAAGMPYRAAEAIMRRQAPEHIEIKDDGTVNIIGSVEQPFTSVYKGLLDHYIEIASEQAGEFIAPAMSKVLRKTPFMGKVLDKLQTRWLSKYKGKTAADFLDKVRTTTGFHGVLGEIGEEYLGDITRAITDVEHFGAGEGANMSERISAAVKTDTANLPAMAIAFAIPGIATNVVNRQLVNQVNKSEEVKDIYKQDLRDAFLTQFGKIPTEEFLDYQATVNAELGYENDYETKDLEGKRKKYKFDTPKPWASAIPKWLLNRLLGLEPTLKDVTAGRESLEIEQRDLNGWIGHILPKIKKEKDLARLPEILTEEAEKEAILFRDSVAETLTGAAIRLKSGEMLTGTTHANILRGVEAEGRTITNEEFDIPAGSGFVTNTGRFVSPEEAWGVADKAGQIKKDEIAKELVDKKYLIGEGVDFDKGAVAGKVEVAPAAQTPTQEAGKVEVFHGTSKTIQELQEPGVGAYSTTNIYGQGFYTTDKESVATGYTKKGTGTEPTVHKVTISAETESKLYDMEQPLPPDEKQAISKIIEDNDFIYEDTLEKSNNLRKIYDDIRNAANDNEVSADDVQDVFDSIAEVLKSKGYVGLKHTGGLISKKVPHNVRILWNPQQDANISTQEAISEIPTFAPKELTELERFRNKMDDVVVDIEQLRPMEKAEISAEQGKRFGEFRNIVNSIDDPRQAMITGMAAMKGRLKRTITPLASKFESSEIYTARKELINSTIISQGELMSGYQGLEKILIDGVIPAPHELQVLQKANLLSKEAIKEILTNRTKYQKAIAFLKDLSFAPWSLLTSIDLSAGGIQGWKILFYDPKLWIQSVGRGYRMLASEDYYNYIELKRKTHPYYAEAIKRGVEETTLDSQTRGEEMFSSNVIQKIPGIRGSGRGFVGVINELRFGWYFKIRESAEGAGMTAKQQKDLADIGMDLTGRGKLPDALKKLQEIGLPFFSPRQAMALIRTPVDLITKKGVGRKMLAHTLVGFVGIVLSTLYLLDQDDKDKIDVEWDARSSDFLKVRHGKTRIDITGGYQPLIRALFQTIYGQRKATETGRIYDVERTEIISRFIQSKLSPHAGLAVDLWRGETFLGEKLELTATGIGKQIYERATPLFIQDTAEAFKYEGFGIPSVLASALGFHGIGVQTYPPTLTQNVRTLKDNLASKYFGESNWDTLGPDAQEAILERHPQIELMEEEAGIDRQDFDFVGRILEQADKAGRKVQKNLNEPIRKELEKYVLDVGNLTRSIGSGWYLDDARYKVYQTEITKSLNLYLNKLLNHSAYKQAHPELRREILKEVIDEVKKEVRLKLITQANFNDLRRREQMK